MFEWSIGGGDVDAGLADADVVVERRIVNHRTAGAAIEPRGVLATWQADRLTLYSSTQIPHIARVVLSIQLGIGEDRIRVVAPEVGGGFGSKLQVYGEEVFACYASREAQPADQVDRHAVGRHAHDPPRARQHHLRQAGRQA